MNRNRTMIASALWMFGLTLAAADAGVGSVAILGGPGGPPIRRGGVDFDPPGGRGLTILWETPIPGTAPWHVYVREDFYGYRFLGAAPAEADRLEWSAGAPGIAPAFAGGPLFGRIYSFRVIRADGQFSPDDLIGTAGPVGFEAEGTPAAAVSLPEPPAVPSGRAEIHDDILGGIDLAPPRASNGMDTDEPHSRALRIAWNFGEDAPALDYHLFVGLDGGPAQFLGQTHDGSIPYFLWSPAGRFHTAPAFADGPQDGRRYHFRVVALLENGGRAALDTGVILYSAPPGEPTPTPAPAGGPTPTPAPTPVPPPPGVVRIEIPGLPAGAKPLDMVRIPAGTFLMGSPPDEAARRENEGPQHEVTLSTGFLLGRYEITQAQFETVAGFNPSPVKGTDLPAMSLTWFEAARFCNRLGQMTGLAPVYDETTWRRAEEPAGFYLPSEAQWELAARGGTQTRFHWGDDPGLELVDQFAWHNGNAGLQPVPVRLKGPNPFGLFDINGNVWEWCSDVFVPYTPEPKIDPYYGELPPDAEEGAVLTRAVRGGGFGTAAEGMRSAARGALKPDSRFGNTGFRVAAPLTLNK